jgi:hypothetical protein
VRRGDTAMCWRGPPKGLRANAPSGTPSRAVKLRWRIGHQLEHGVRRGQNVNDAECNLRVALQFLYGALCSSSEPPLCRRLIRDRITNAVPVPLGLEH